MRVDFECETCYDVRVSHAAVCGFFAADEEDADLIKSLLVDIYDFDFASNINRKIIIWNTQQVRIFF